ncbi:hypothetical protein K469DRAFT_701685 [Zopfia rhizophila CBS 207.26]|uniref:HNH nuclease domain-containing protein n=1 Tax=Zopfia rhizophila CBS 207.26 TaxID=1314779 RepID=A0A6A6EE89_9PEZI|nr:hypothetical protein K469DRAFT_701685 [Zopfia rhizophila CBS 207.26]
MASTGGSEAEFHDPRRQKLLRALNDALPGTIRPTAWACLWLSDIDSLANLVAQAQVSPLAFVGFFESIEISTRIVPTWTQRKRPASAASTPQNPSTPLQPSTPQRPTTPLQPPPSQLPPSAQGSGGQKRNNSGQCVVTRSKVQRALCHQRDQKKCILTKSGEPNEVAHIYPFSMRYEDNTIKQQGPSFWDTLRIAYFALKPIRMSDDKKRLDIQFFWLSSTPHVPGVNVLQVPSLSALDQGPNLAKLFNHETNIPICSGYEISLETDDPVSRPLPDFRLLEMQWFLHRVTAMSGAAEPQDDFHDDDSDDDIVEALQNRWDMDTEDDWDMDIEEWPATSPERFWEGRFPAQLPGIQTFGHMVTLRGGEDAKEKTAKEKTAKEKTAKEKTAKEKTAKEKTTKTSNKA